MSVLSRRAFLASLALPAVASPLDLARGQPFSIFGGSSRAEMYGAVDDLYPVPSVDLSRVGPDFLRTEVAYRTGEPPGTIVVDPAAHYLFHVGEGGTATRYGVGVGREGFGWSGNAVIGAKQVWPDWYPPREMLARQPDLMRQMSTLPSGVGMYGGPGNPLGARALYLWKDNRDTLFRIHGTFEPWTIGKSVSSGCIRMINQDAMHLYGKIDIGTRVVVLGSRKGRRGTPRTAESVRS